MSETDLWFGTLSATVRVEDLPASRQVVAIELPAAGQWRVCGAGASNAEGVATLPITGLPTSRIYAVAIDDWGRPFVPGMTVAFGDVIRPTQFLGWMYQVTSPGVLPGEEPEWWNGMAGIPQPVGTAMMQAIRHYQPIAHGPVSDIEWEEKEFDPHWDKVVALLHFDGDLTDETGRVWGVSKGSANYVAGVFSSAIYFDNSLAIKTTNHGSLNLNNDNFTIEFFCKYDSSSTGQVYILAKYETLGNNREFLLLKESGKSSLTFMFSKDGGLDRVFMDTGILLSDLKSLKHVAITREGSVFKYFLSGVLKNTQTGISSSIYASSADLFLGSDEHIFNGVIDELRITKGVARYIEDFDPPTAPFPNVGPPL